MMHLRFPWVVTFVGLAAACGGGAIARPDAGRRDAGNAVDAAQPLDAAQPPDAGDRPDAATMTDAAGADDGGPILPPLDAGNPFGDAGTIGAPEWVELDVRVDGTTCAPLVACGGDEVGTWDVAGGCFEVPVPPELMRCPGATFTSGTGRARGRVTFAGGVAMRTSQWEVEVDIFVPAVCASFAGGCDGIASALRGAVPDSACVTEGAGDCRCAARQTGTIDDGDAYRTESNQIVSVTSGKRWEYCIDGTSLRYRDVSATGMREPGIITLSRR